LQHERLQLFSLTVSHCALPALTALLPAGSTVTCPGALVISAASSNVRISIASITLSSGAALGTCTPTLSAIPTAQAALVLDPTSVNGASITCDAVSAALQQDDFEASLVSWSITVGSATAVGSGASVTGGQIQLQKVLTQVRKYQLGIKRIPLAAEALAAVTTNSEWDAVAAGRWHGLLWCISAHRGWQLA
jgi:hypothetical protein